MDGAGKFVKGDAIAALVIVVLNLIGGIVVGLAYHGMSVLDALNTFAILSIGNALVTTLPAFLLSTSMGLMVTRVAGDGSLGIDIATQVLERPGVLRAAGAFAAVLTLVPALPHVLFAVLGAGLFGVAHYASRSQAARACAATATHDLARRAAIRRPEMALALVGTDAVAIDIGADLAALLAPPLADALLDRIGEVRRALAGDIGIVLPGVRLRDDLAREPATYAIRVRDGLAGEGRLRLDRVLAVADDAVLARLGGEHVREPVYGMPAAWLEPQRRESAMEAGALVFDPISIVGSHLAEVARTHASALLGRQELHTLLEHLRASVPSLVKEIGNDGVPLATVHRVFEALLRERVWPRDPVGTLEALVDAAATTRDPRELTRSGAAQTRAEARETSGCAGSRAVDPRVGIRIRTASVACRRHVLAASRDRIAPANECSRVCEERRSRTCRRSLHVGATPGARRVLRSFRGPCRGLRLRRVAARTRTPSGPDPKVPAAGGARKLRGALPESNIGA